MEANKNKNLGNAGEFYVLAQLAQRGYIAGKTDDGQTLIDVIATEPETLTTVNIQVKATGNYDKVPSWIMSKKNEDVFESLWYVLVEIGDEKIIPNFFIFHSSEIGPWLKNNHSYWLGIPKRDGSPRKDTNMRRFAPTYDELQLHKDNWSQMFK